MDQVPARRENEERKRTIGMMALDLGEGKKEGYLRVAKNKQSLADLLGLSRKQIYSPRKKEMLNLADKQSKHCPSPTPLTATNGWLWLSAGATIKLKGSWLNTALDHQEEGPKSCG